MIARHSRMEIVLPDDLRDFLVSAAERAGYSDIGDYVLSVLSEMQESKVAGVADQPAPAPTAWELALRIGTSVPESEWARVPPDLAANLDHYLYGAPREA